MLQEAHELSLADYPEIHQSDQQSARYDICPEVHTAPGQGHCLALGCSLEDSETLKDSAWSGSFGADPSSSCSVDALRAGQLGSGLSFAPN